MQFSGITVGVPREIMLGERRVAATPETVKHFVSGGAKVLIETGAGEKSLISDEQYREAGAEVVLDFREVCEKANIILKVKEPKFNDKLGKHEVEFLTKDSVFISFLHPANPSNHATVKELSRKGVTSFTMDSIPRISRAQQMDALTSMSTAAGYKAIIIAANHLLRFVPMMPTAAGIIKPAQFLVVGTGVAGLQAIATAKRLGAKVKALDIRPEANEQAKSLGAEIVSFDLPAELSTGEGGYAKVLPEKWHAKEREVLTPVVQSSDVVILAALVFGEKAPVLVDRTMVEGMKKGAVIVDISVDQGGNCELVRAGEEYVYKDIMLSGLLNIPATLSVDTTEMYSKSLWQFLKHIVKEGRVDSAATDPIIKESLVTNNFKVVHKGTLLAMQGGDK